MKKDLILPYHSNQLFLQGSKRFASGNNAMFTKLLDSFKDFPWICSYRKSENLKQSSSTKNSPSEHLIKYPLAVCFSYFSNKDFANFSLLLMGLNFIFPIISQTEVCISSVHARCKMNNFTIVWTNEKYFQILSSPSKLSLVILKIQGNLWTNRHEEQINRSWFKSDTGENTIIGVLTVANWLLRIFQGH